MHTLTIKNLHVSIDGKAILKGIDLTLNQGETIALFGPNGHGKSTLLMTIMGHPRYHVDEGEILLDGKDILKLSPSERSRLGLFLAMQLPVEVPGVPTADFLRSAINARREKPISLSEFYKLLNNATKEVNFPFDMVNRSLNEGFSGGEKKKNEIMQMRILNPLFALVDEIDSGLDVDAINYVAKALKEEQNAGKGILIISHYARLYEIVKPSRVVIIVDGRIVFEGDSSYVEKIDVEGYEWLEEEYGISLKKGEDAKPKVISLGSCAVKKNRAKEKNESK